MIIPPKLNQDQKGICKGCALSKNTKGAFHSSESKSSNILEFIHANLCGPMSKSYLGGFLYNIILVDDYSKKT